MTTHYARRGGKRRSSDQQALAAADHRCVLYIRASTVEQQHSLKGQDFEGQQWAERHHLDHQASFIESGVSGSKPFLRRPEAKKAIAYMKRHGIGTLLVRNLNRGFRNVDDMRQTVDFLVDNGLALRIADPDIDARGSYGKFLATVLAAVGELQLSETKDQQRRAFDQMRRDRVALNQNPRYGWDLGPDHPTEKAKSGRPYKTLVPNPTEQAVLRRILAWRDRGRTYEEIADALNGERIPTKLAGQTYTRKGVTKKYSGLWTHQTVNSVAAYAELAEECEPTDH